MHTPTTVTVTNFSTVLPLSFKSVFSIANCLESFTNQDHFAVVGRGERRPVAPLNAHRLGLPGREGTEPTQVATGRDSLGRVRSSEKVQRQRKGTISNAESL